MRYAYVLCNTIFCCFRIRESYNTLTMYYSLESRTKHGIIHVLIFEKIVVFFFSSLLLQDFYIVQCVYMFLNEMKGKQKNCIESLSHSLFATIHVVVCILVSLPLTNGPGCGHYPFGYLYFSTKTVSQFKFRSKMMTVIVLELWKFV